MSKTPINPFRYDRLPADEAFVDREHEVARIVASIKHGENLLIHGQRRIGKTSCLLRAARHAAAKYDATCFFADLSRYVSLADVTEALLANAVPRLSSLGTKTGLWLASVVKGLVVKPAATASIDATKSGGSEIELSLSLELRAKDSAAHISAFIEVLDAIDVLAGKRQRPVAVLLDEFTFIEKIGPSNASWILRGAIQRHKHVVYILAGSAQHLIDQMHGAGGAFHGMFGRLAMGPLPAGDFSRWIDRMFSRNGITSNMVGLACINSAGPRTRDIIQLARRTFDLSAASRVADSNTVTAARDSLVGDFESEFENAWNQLPLASQAVLVAVAAGEGKTLFSEATRSRFGLGSTAEVSQTCRRLTRTAKKTRDFRNAILTRHETTTELEHIFDDPFFGVWVGGLQRRIRF